MIINMKAKYSVIYNDSFVALALVLKLGPHKDSEKFMVLCPGKDSLMMRFRVRVREDEKKTKRK